ncbi:Arc family DNA-binding protein [Sinirhodobacter ferrireducens]|uniref:Arc family DNA-binding protein n=1 Tax=Paenirhodobacter ferrireducens TaxID=1215032 RepID=A0A443L9M6_9RHOB|nr:Arc family DNA-binding protein [Sinirhodobacter ferrireducens]RWR45876.1 Arc family DNA-binding protein [Sinirhodobacter ferrireducens]
MAEEQNRTLNDKFMLRLPDGMRDRIKAAAEANNRSMNAEIVATLEEKYPAPKLPIREIARSIATLLTLVDSEDRDELVRKLQVPWDAFAERLGPHQATTGMFELAEVLNNIEKSLGRRLTPEDIEDLWDLIPSSQQIGPKN